jgi:hypothetical protein
MSQKMNKIRVKNISIHAKNSLVVLATLLLSQSLFALDFFCGDRNSSYVYVRNESPAVVAGTEAQLQVRIHWTAQNIYVAQYSCTKTGKVGEFAKRAPVRVTSPSYFCQSDRAYLPTVTLDLAYDQQSDAQGADAALMKVIPNSRLELRCRDL